MPIVKMDRLTVVGLDKDKDSILDALMRLGALEIIGQPEGTLLAAGSNTTDNLDPITQLQSILTRLEKTIELSRKLNTEKKPMFSSKRQVSSIDFLSISSRETEIMDRVRQIEHNQGQIAELSIQKHRLQSNQLLLEPWQDLEMDLAEQGTEHVRLFLGSFDTPEQLDALTAQLQEDAPETLIRTIADGETGLRCAVATWKPRGNLVLGHLRRFGFNSMPLQGEKGTPLQQIGQNREQLAVIESELEKLAADNLDLASFGHEYETLHDALTIRYDRLQALAGLTGTHSTFWLEGWVPTHLVKEITRGLKERFLVAFDHRPALPGEEYPILFNNNPLVKSFEVIVEMYGPPSSQETDPTPVLAPFFFIFFGMMLSDIGYGLILVALTSLLIFKVKAKGEMGRIARMLFLGGISSIIWGFLFGGFFGDIVSVLSNQTINIPALWFNPMDDPTQLMLWSMILGILHLFAGMAMRAYLLFKTGHGWDAVFDIFPLYVMIIGLGLMFGRIGGNLGMIMAVTGVAVIILFGGREAKNPVMRILKGLMALYTNIAGYFGDILSYTRILALVMATSVIAMVFNLLGFIGGPSLGGILLFIPVALVGHTLNLSLSTLSAYVHTSRLHYVEFFGKFYEGTGRIWRPLKLKTRYVDIERQNQPELKSDMKRTNIKPDLKTRRT